MSADLERDLLEAGDGLGDVVAALRRAPQARVPEGFAARVMSRLPRKGGFVRAKWLSPSVLLAVAASLVAAFVFVSLVFRPAPQDPSAPSLSACQRGDGSFSSSSAAPYVQAFAVAALAKDPSLDRAALARDFTQAVSDELVPRAIRAAELSGRKTIVAAGGVAANSFLRADLQKACDGAGLRLFVPPLSLCGDNGAMIGAQGYYEYLAGARADWSLNAFATREIDEPLAAYGAI